MYPLDRRRLALHIYPMLNSLRKTAALVMVSHSTVARWARYPERKQYIRVQPTKSRIVAESIRAAVVANPLESLRTLKGRIAEATGETVSHELIRTVIRRLGFTHKKVRFHNRPDHVPKLTSDFVAARDALWKQGRCFVSIDETSFGRNGRPVMGYAPRGTPLYMVRKGSPYTQNTSAVACVSDAGLVHVEMKKGSYKTDTFCQFLGSLLLPLDTVILLDNVKFHHSASVRTLAAEKGWTLLYVPPYSPWFNPIEGCFSVVKRAFRRGVDAFDAFRTLTPGHCASFFRRALRLSNGPLG
jgi:transposase